MPKASDLLAAQLRASILSGDYLEGKLLPNERELSERSGLSRPSVREALRILEVEGLIVTKPGRNGGSAIRRPGHDSLQHSLNLFIWGQKISLGSLLEVRETIEPSAARFAALHRTDTDLTSMGQLHEQLLAAGADAQKFSTANVDWHAAVVRASHNTLLVSFYDAIVGAIHDATNAEDFHSAQVRDEVIRAHQRIMDAIVAGDGEAAARRMLKHMAAFGKQFQTWIAAGAGPAVQTPDVNAQALKSTPPRGRTLRKRAAGVT